MTVKFVFQAAIFFWLQGSFVFLLRFDWCGVTERLKQALFVEPIHPLQGFPFDLIFGFSRPQSIDDFGFKHADDRLGESVVISVSDTANGRFKPGIYQQLCVLDRYILGGFNRSSQHPVDGGVDDQNRQTKI